MFYHEGIMIDVCKYRCDSLSWQQTASEGEFRMTENKTCKSCVVFQCFLHQRNFAAFWIQKIYSRVAQKEKPRRKTDSLVVENLCSYRGPALSFQDPCPLPHSSLFWLPQAPELM